MKLWIVYALYQQTGKIEEVAAYFSEDAARERAHDMVGAELLIGLRTIEVKDSPPENAGKAA